MENIPDSDKWQVNFISKGIELRYELCGRQSFSKVSHYFQIIFNSPTRAPIYQNQTCPLAISLSHS